MKKFFFTIFLVLTLFHVHSFEFKRKLKFSFSTQSNDEDVLLLVDTSDLIKDNYLDGFCLDIEFLDMDNQVLDYWIESGCGEAVTSIFVRFATINDGDNEAWMYYSFKEHKKFPNFRPLGKKTFTETYYLLKNNSVCDNGFTRFQNISDRSIKISKENSKLFETGGKSPVKHSHSKTGAISDQTSDPDKVKNALCDGGSIFFSPATHTHLLDDFFSEDESPNIPKIYITLCGGTGPLKINDGHILLVDKIVEDGDGNFPLLQYQNRLLWIDNDKTGMVEGNATFIHNHVFSPPNMTHVYTESYSTDTSGGSPLAIDDHYHQPISVNMVTSEEEHLPEYYSLIPISSQKGKVPNFLNLLVTELPPIGYEYVDAAEKRYLLYDGSIDVSTGGKADHEHSFGITFTQGSGGVVGSVGSCNGTKSTHYHSFSGKFDNKVANDPSFIYFKLARRKNDVEFGVEWKGIINVGSDDPIWEIYKKEKKKGNSLVWMAVTFPILSLCFFGCCVVVCAVLIVLVVSLFILVKKKQKEKYDDEALELGEKMDDGMMRDTMQSEASFHDFTNLRDVSISSGNNPHRKSQALLNIKKDLFVIDYKDLKLGKKIAKGGSGSIVMRGKYKEIDVAVKIFDTSFMIEKEEEYFFDNFENEVELLASLRHPNIISFIGASLHPPRIAICTEYCSYSLSDYIKLKRKLDWTRILRILLGVSKGIYYIHERNIIHRDIKCENVLLDRHYVPKIIDLGLSKLKHTEVNDARMTNRVGTSYYMAPGDDYDKACDIFSFSIILWEVLHWSIKPFGSESSYVEYKVAKDGLRPKITEKVTKKNGWYVNLMKNCWKFEPSERPKMVEIIDAFQKAIENKPMVPNRGRRPSTKALKPKKKKPPIPVMKKRPSKNELNLKKRPKPSSFYKVLRNKFKKSPKSPKSPTKKKGGIFMFSKADNNNSDFNISNEDLRQFEEKRKSEEGGKKEDKFPPAPNIILPVIVNQEEGKDKEKEIEGEI